MCFIRVSISTLRNLNHAPAVTFLDHYMWYVYGFYLSRISFHVITLSILNISYMEYLWSIYILQFNVLIVYLYFFIRFMLWKVIHIQCQYNWPWLGYIFYYKTQWIFLFDFSDITVVVCLHQHKFLMLYCNLKKQARSL